MTMIEGPLAKMTSTIDEAGKVHYRLPLGEQQVALNPLLGQALTLRYADTIVCEACGQFIKKSYGQGFCFMATKRLAQCDLCIVKPELCHHHKDTCREPKWGLKHCFQPHIVYLSNASGLKVGITRKKNIPSRWVDQGATQALPILAVSSRRIAGLIEVKIAQHISDKTNWRQMLKQAAEPVDLVEKAQHVLALVAEEIEALKAKFAPDCIEALPLEAYSFDYTVLTYPTKISSFNFDKQPEVKGTLLGIKGQYLIFDTGVINIRKFTGYQVQLSWSDKQSTDVMPYLRHYPYADQPPCQR